MTLNSVLIVDDCESDRYLLSRLIRRTKITDTVLEATDGAEGLELFRDRTAQQEAHGDKFPPSLVFLDINMPRVNGFEFLEQFEVLRHELDYQSVVLIMVSSSQREQDRERAESYDFVKGFLSKMPLSDGVLRQALEGAGIALD